MWKREERGRRKISYERGTEERRSGERESWERKKESRTERMGRD